jgi:hypothetical protein
MNAAAVHLLLNNFPPILNLAGLVVLVSGLASKSVALTRAAFAVLLCAALIAVPVFLSGKRAKEIVKEVQAVDVVAIEPHQEAALAAFAFLILEGVVCLVALAAKPRPAITMVVVFIAVITTALVFFTSRLGVRIHHPEVQIRRV